MNFSNDDLKQLSELGISKEKVISQIESFKKGFPYIDLNRPATFGDGIDSFASSQFDSLIQLFEEAAKAGRILKFVPASGAASRMFHSLSYLYSHYEKHKDELMTGISEHPDVTACLDFFNNIEKFPFYEEIRGVENPLRSKNYGKILELLINENELGYTSRPKALIKFHRYSDYSRTALEEHLTEAQMYAKDSKNISRIHFTISPEHRKVFAEFTVSARSRYETLSYQLDITFSEQKKSTDAISLNLNDEPFRDNAGRLVFRPAGHGALLENLNESGGDIVFIKNIDNVVPDRLKQETILHKKLLAGYLLQLQKHAYYYLHRITQNDLSGQELTDAFEFAKNQLNFVFPEKIESLRDEEKIKILFDKLDRPIRVCGMVKNQGEPGGGPFWIKEADGIISLQIIEKNQIDTSLPEQKKILESSSHFNPVDLVCGIRDYKGENFDLRRFCDPHTGFISIKSRDGKSIKAMELPGLWNGAMAHWITVFVEVPLITFNPVKNVNDLLRPEHQT